MTFQSDAGHTYVIHNNWLAYRSETLVKRKVSAAYWLLFNELLYYD